MIHKKIMIVLLSVTSLLVYSQEDFNVYIKDRLISPNLRERTFVDALTLCSERNVKIMVETGTARAGAAGFNGDGGSTIILGHWAYVHGAKLFSVDINQGYLDASKYSCLDYSQNITFVCSDSLEYLKNFKEKIDFLYLDSLDYDFNNPSISQIHHLNEIKIVYDKLHDGTIIMIDDCGELPGGGKGGLVIPWLMERGWKIFRKEYQVIMVR